MEYISFKATSKSTGDGVVEAIVSVFGNVDSYNERVMPGAFKASLENKPPKFVWMHDWAHPIAKVLEAKELPPGDPLLPENLKELGGLYVKAEFNKDIEDSWQAYLKIKAGYVDEYSFGYRTIKSTTNEDTKVTDLLELDLFECGPVLVGANRATQTLSVKQDLSAMPSGCSLDEHTELLADRWEKNAEDRDSKGELTPDFFTRLDKAAQKMLGIVEKFKPRDGESKAPTDELEFIQACHMAQLRAIRG